ncbi:MAG: hypothetical protein VYD19_08590, partial [Myxococcota bacterium]|nr:hypothetical protein [Myxococcota bacterium]
MSCQPNTFQRGVCLCSRYLYRVLLFLWLHTLLCPLAHSTPSLPPGALSEALRQLPRGELLLIVPTSEPLRPLARWLSETLQHFNLGEDTRADMANWRCLLRAPTAATGALIFWRARHQWRLGL